MNNQTHSNLVLILHYLFKITCVAAGFGTVYLGYRLFILGVTGKASLSLQTDEVRFQLLNAAPGLFFAIGGVWIVVCAIRKGAQISSRPSKHGINLAANESQRPCSPDEIEAIGPHVPFDYKKGSP